MKGLKYTCVITFTSLYFSGQAPTQTVADATLDIYDDVAFEPSFNPDGSIPIKSKPAGRVLRSHFVFLEVCVQNDNIITLERIFSHVRV